ncbi:UNVERIFIED_CONTAM: hypothetical protein Scaly_1553200 [Sesamum calycinum]|uniref:Uncharacterized protein n=1 Tax=Sesamum calycinum TaxID=2727403 RepID=A0AAW2P6D2_9LAMI
MAYHARSNSLPSKSHPTVEDFEDHLIRLKSSAEATSSSWALELLDGSMRLLDCCGIAKDITAIVKESVQELESSLRRSRGEAVMAHDIDAYMSSRREVIKRIKKCIKEHEKLQTILSNAILDTDQDLKTITGTLKESKAIGFSIPQVCDDAPVWGKGQLKTKKLVTRSKIYPFKTSTFCNGSRK